MLYFFLVVSVFWRKLLSSGGCDCLSRALEDEDEDEREREQKQEEEKEDRKEEEKEREKGHEPM